MSQQLQISFDRPRNDRQNQCEAILNYLKSGQSITPLDALEKFRCFRLTSRIWDLKQQGWNIEREMVKVPSGKHVAQYRLVQKEMKSEVA